MVWVSVSSSASNSKVGMTHSQMVDGFSATTRWMIWKRWHESVYHLTRVIPKLSWLILKWLMDLAPPRGQWFKNDGMSHCTTFYESFQSWLDSSSAGCCKSDFGNEKNHKHLQNYFYINPFGRHNLWRPTTTANHQADPTCPLLVSRETNCCTKTEKLERLERWRRIWR